MLNHDHGFEVGAGGAPVLPAQEELSPYEVFQRIGELTRKLHDALHALGYHKNIEQAVGALPDARARLDYIAEVTGKSADKVLTAAENGRSVQEALGADAGTLIDVWKRAGDRPNAILVEETLGFLGTVRECAAETNDRFSEIMVAQDFHDLTGQTINRIIQVATHLEEQLVKLLLEATPPGERAKIDLPGLGGGPVIGAISGDDVVHDQAQVDDLLESLGF